MIGHLLDAVGRGIGRGAATVLGLAALGWAVDKALGGRRWP